MNLNILSYLLFLPAMLAVAMWTARSCHRNGRVWMLGLFDGDAAFVDAVNNVLLIACYTLNLGYVSVVVSQWEPIRDLPQMLTSLGYYMSIILLTLALVHFSNISALLIWSRFKSQRSTNTSKP